jgi:hypothetical protein
MLSKLTDAASVFDGCLGVLVRRAVGRKVLFRLGITGKDEG